MKSEIYSQEYLTDSLTMDLLDFLKTEFNDEEGYLFYRFPIIKELDLPIIYPDIFMISQKFGVVLIVCDNITTIRGNQLDQLYYKADKIDSIVFSSLKRPKNVL